MVFSMNVFKNKKRWQNKNVKKRNKRALNKKRKKRFFTSMACTAELPPPPPRQTPPQQPNVMLAESYTPANHRLRIHDFRV